MKPENIPTLSPQMRLPYRMENLSRRPGNHLLVGAEHYFKQLITPFSCSIMLLVIIKHLFPLMHQNLCSAALRCDFTEKYMEKFRPPLLCGDEHGTDTCPTDATSFSELKCVVPYPG